MFYSGMFPGVISGEYSIEDCQIDLRLLARKANVSLIIAEINGLNILDKTLLIEGRPAIRFSQLSLDVGCETAKPKGSSVVDRDTFIMPIKPFFHAIKWLYRHDEYAARLVNSPFSVVGSGLAGLEIVMALRKRWPDRSLNLQVKPNQINQKIQKILKEQKINLVIGQDFIQEPAFLCTGGAPPKWLKTSGLPVDSVGRVVTLNTMQVIGYPFVFAVGDCGVIQKLLRPPAGVWAVKASRPLALNLERSSRGLKPLPWKPQRFALQLVGGPFTSNASFALAFFGKFMVGPQSFLWQWKKFLDKRFVKMFDQVLVMKVGKNDEKVTEACRGCAAKVAAKPLKVALKQSNLSELSEYAEDAALVFSLPNGTSWIQSVDAFPALVSDPWLNARLTTLHACSDIWASGATVHSAQPVISLPAVPEGLQQDLLVQILKGIQSVLDPQSGQIIGGHTFESRAPIPKLITMGIEISLTVNGQLEGNRMRWSKKGLQPGDDILLSRGIGSGVLFAATMNGNIPTSYIDLALSEMSTSQYFLVESLLKNNKSSLVHACTDITGFGLLGHLGEMLSSSNSVRIKDGLSPLKITLEAEDIPVFYGALELLSNGFSSTLAPSNRSFWNLLETTSDSCALFELSLGNITHGSEEHKNIMELIVDPQTCGPLALACSTELTKNLLSQGTWYRIGSVGLL
tara:strand:- start:5917 stop:7971 length:2055 start_codon:yes stop_codon:yes gene_type:complete